MGLPITATLAILGALGQPAHLTVRSSSVVIEADRAVGDVLVVDGAIELGGVVRGFVYAVSSTVTLRSSAVVLSPMAMHGGALIIDDGARLPRSMTLAGVEVIGEIPPETRVDRLALPSRATRRAMTRYLPFERPIPGAGLGLADVAAWSPGPEYIAEEVLDDPRELVVGGVARLTFTSDKVVAVVQRRYASPQLGSLVVTGVELADADTGAAFWDAIARIPERAVSSSVRTALGDGAHWWFVRDGRGCLMWRRDRWFFAVETRAAEGRADPLALTDRARIALTQSFGQEAPR